MRSESQEALPTDQEEQRKQVVPLPPPPRASWQQRMIPSRFGGAREPVGRPVEKPESVPESKQESAPKAEEPLKEPEALPVVQSAQSENETAARAADPKKPGETPEGKSVEARPNKTEKLPAPPPNLLKRPKPPGWFAQKMGVFNEGKSSQSENK